MCDRKKFRTPFFIRKSGVRVLDGLMAMEKILSTVEMRKFWIKIWSCLSVREQRVISCHDLYINR